MSLARWFGRAPGDALSRAVYDRIVAQARLPKFYAGLGVPDTPEGRFEMLALHLFLVLHRLKRERGDPILAALAQRLADRLVADMDANLREMGAGDLGVGRRVKRMAGALYGRIAAYEAGLDAGEAALRATLRRTVFATAAPAEEQVAAAVQYLLAARDLLAARRAAELAQGMIDFPKM
jgi:cytochrome b pre-mRNA-processing protein 3